MVAITPRAGGPAGEVQRNRRQEETFRKVLAAGIEVLRETSYADLTVRAVAARAKVAPATAYTYFSSKDRKSTRLNSSHITRSRMPSSA